MNFAEKKYFPWEGNNGIFDENEKATDVNGVELNLYKGTYEMMGCQFNVMIKKGLDLKSESYDLLRGFDTVKRVKVLGIVDENHNWDHIRGFINWCAEKCGVTKDHLTESFCQYIRKSYYKVENLKAYPDNWDYRKKGEYLMSLVVTDHAQMRIFLGAAEIDWPYQSKHRVYNNLPILLRKIIDWEEGNNRKYSTLDAMNYIILLRNLYKHYDQLPEEIKAILIDRKALIEMIEHWTPGIWMKIYERAGWPQY